jgi:hypothetical protein
MRRRRQAVLEGAADGESEAPEIGPSIFLPGQVPARFQPDPRVTPAWRRIRKAVLRRDRFRCSDCGGPASDVDHRVELIDGGAAFAIENLQALCEPCHDAKTSEARHQRALRASSSWGRMALCPRCAGTGLCPECESTVHPCTTCLGVRIVPERCLPHGEIPSQYVLARVSSLAWAGASAKEG